MLSRLNIEGIKSSSESKHLENNNSEPKLSSQEESKSSPKPKNKEHSDSNAKNKSLEGKKSSSEPEPKPKDKCDSKLRKVASHNTAGRKTTKSQGRETLEEGLGKPHRLQVADKYVQSVVKEPKEVFQKCK